MDYQLRAITDQTRREILRQLAVGERSAGSIARLFNVTRPAISHHLRVLRDSGLVTVRKKAQSRLYSIDAAAVGRLRARFDEFWDHALPRLKMIVESDYRNEETENDE